MSRRVIDARHRWMPRRRPTPPADRPAIARGFAPLVAVILAAGFIAAIGSLIAAPH